MKLCRRCRWCRPVWSLLAIPPFGLFPAMWQGFWRDATCRHPTSFWESRPAGEIVTRGDFGPRRRRKPRRMDCNSARRHDKHCGLQARYFAARGYPHWLWPAGSIIGGLLAVAGFCLLLIFLLSHVFPVPAAERPFDWDRYHERQDACAEKDRIAAACAKGLAYCGELALQQATRACSPFRQGDGR
jgi:hypothetical protein